METQASLRERLLARRRSLSRDEVMASSRVIQAKVVALSEFQRGGMVALYRPFWNEVETGHLLRSVLDRGGRVCFPRVGPSGMDFVIPGVEEVVPLDRIDLIVVPGVVFDEKRYRIGLGKGFYDKTLASYRGVTVGLGYDFQVVNEMPHNPHDLVCHHVISEMRDLKQ